MSDFDQALAAPIQALRKRLAEVRRLVVLTGAGVSAESGVPTFRGQDGLWRQYRAVDLATPQAFAHDPALVWEFYNWRRELLEPLRPNPAHLALAELERCVPHMTLVTQNIDGLHQLAGSRNLVELHGNIWWVRCSRCRRVTEDRRVPLPALPTCNECGGLLRPHVVWFGEALFPEILDRAYQAIGSAEVMLVIGTSGVVQPAASMGVHARGHGAFVAEINLEPTSYSELFDLSLQGRAGEVVPRLLSEEDVPPRPPA